MTETNAGDGRRWRIAAAGTVLQLCLGTVYAWSYFQRPLAERYGWSNAQVAWAFSLAICFLGLAAAWGGMNLPRIGPRRLAMAGGTLFGGGYLVAAMALKFHSLPLLYLGYGVMGGIGLGLGYVTPVATVAKWFPDRKGLATGLVIMGFGLGALLMSKVLAPALMAAANGDLVIVLAGLGVLFMPLTMLCGWFLRNPPAEVNTATAAVDWRAAKEHLLSRRFLLMWIVFFCNIAAGIAVIGFQSPLLQDLLQRRSPSLPPHALATYGATLIAVSSLFNGLGRFFWGGLSDRLGRARTFRLLLVTQIAAFALLAMTSSPWLFAALVCYVLLCYGGGFGTMPSFVLDVFGGRMMPAVYGAILTAWSAAGVAGPQVLAWLKDHHPARAPMLAFSAGAALLGAGLICSLLASDKPAE